MRARWVLPAMVLVVVAGCGSRVEGADPAAAVASPAASWTPRSPQPMPTPTLTPERRFLADVRREGLSDRDLTSVASEEALLAVGEQACGTFDSAMRSPTGDTERVYQIVVASAAAVLLQRDDPTGTDTALADRVHRQVDNLVSSAVRNLCPRNTFVLAVS